jgi:hypothetical protein
MTSYYDIAGHIRYYGHLPTGVEKTEEAVFGDVPSGIWGKSVLTVDWSALLETARPSGQSFDLGSRKEAVHEALANMALGVNSLYVFTKRWGFLDGDLDTKSGLLQTRPQHVEQFQNLLQRAWRGQGDAISEIAKDVVARIDIGSTGIDIAVVDLRNLVRLLFMRDHVAGRTKICANDDCRSPYFIQQRRGQKYCTHKCAVLINVRRFREQEAKAEAKSRPKKKGGTK